MSEINKFSTPIERKSKNLGLRRTIDKTTVNNTPSSDIKIDYKSLQQITDSPLTPITRKCLDEVRSTNCRPYRLSLNRNIRNSYKKKKLEFPVKSKSIPSTSTETTLVPDDCGLKCDILELDKSEHLTNDGINAEIETEETKLQEHTIKVKELKASIDVWTKGFQDAIQELSALTETSEDNQQLLAQLGIPQNMVKYLE